MRIVGGEFRGRPLAAPPGLDIRPTADRTREALFNLLEHGRMAAAGSPVAGASVLDAFCGTGALGLEALSRGADHVVFMDHSQAALAAARGNAAPLGIEDRMTFLRADASRPPKPTRPAGLVFLDPPYGEALAGAAIVALDAAGWIDGDAVVAVETGSKDAFEAPSGFTLEDARVYGRAKVWLLRRG